MKIRIYGDPVLRQVSEDVTEFDEELQKVTTEMVAAMIDNEGVGLAAPQVGILERFLVIGLPVEGDEDKRRIFVIINPEILEHSEESVIGEEGCLSLPDITEDVSRYNSIKVRFQDIFGEFHEIATEGYFARVIQHETDHLEGVLLVDRISPLKRSLLRGKLKRLREQQKEINVKA